MYCGPPSTLHAVSGWYDKVTLKVWWWLYLQDCGTSLTVVSDEHLYRSQQQQQPHQSACYPLNDRLLCLQCHLRRLSPPGPSIAVTSTTSSSGRGSAGTCWERPRRHDNEVTWPPVGVASDQTSSSSLFVDVTLDGDASSCTTTTSGDDVTTASDDVISNPGSDVVVAESPAAAAAVSASQRAAEAEAAAPVPAGDQSAWSVDSGHCSGASDVTSDVTVTSSSDTETLDAGSDDDDDDDESRVTSETLERRSNATALSSCDSSLSILDLLADDSSRVTDLWPDSNQLRPPPVGTRSIPVTLHFAVDAV